MTVAVLGAGLAGLAAAHELTRAGAEVVLLEQERRAGGVVLTDRVDGRWVAEGGPDSFLSADREIPALAEEVGVADRMVSESIRGSLAWDGNSLAPLKEGEAAALLGFDVKPGDLAPGFKSFAGGMQTLTDAVAAQLGPVMRRAGVTALRVDGKGYHLSVTSAAGFSADAVVIALPGAAAARLLRGLDQRLGDILGDVVYQPSLTVSLGYRREQVKHPLDATGYLVRPEVSDVARACTFASSKFPGRAPQGHVLLRVFLSHGEGEATALARARIEAVLGVKGDPVFSRVFYWPRGLPRYGREHPKGMATLRAELAPFPPVAVAGGACDGPGMSACVRSGRDAARAVLARL